MVEDIGFLPVLLFQSKYDLVERAESYLEELVRLLHSNHPLYHFLEPVLPFDRMEYELLLRKQYLAKQLVGLQVERAFEPSDSLRKQFDH